MYDHPELLTFATDRSVLLCIALFLEAIVGRISWLFRLIPHPFDAFRHVAGFFGRRLNKSRRGPRALVVRGAIITLFLCGLTMLVGWELSVWLATIRSGGLVDLALLMLLVSQRGSYSDASRTVGALTRGGLTEARKRARAFHRGNVDLLDDHGICRAITEYLAGELGRWLLGPVFWYLLLGLPGLLLYAAIIAASRSLAHDDEARAGFGWMANRLEMLAGIIPGWIAGHLVVVASLLAPTARPIQAWRTMYATARTLPNALYGWPAAAFAGALSMEIGGPHSTEGRRLPWFGAGSPRLTECDAHRAMLLFGYTCVLHAALAAGLAVVGLVLLR
jgi:adenosylcobinamide-phosphate synthase